MAGRTAKLATFSLHEFEITNSCKRTFFRLRQLRLVRLIQIFLHSRSVVLPIQRNMQTCSHNQWSVELSVSKVGLIFQHMEDSQEQYQTYFPIKDTEILAPNENIVRSESLCSGIMLSGWLTIA